jgi:hypothetical protein
MLPYAATLTHDEENGDYVVIFRDCPRLARLGKRLEISVRDAA